MVSAARREPPATTARRPANKLLSLGLDRTVVFDASAPTATLLAADTSFKFAQHVNSVLVQNNTAAALYAALDQTASPGALYIAPGQTLIIDWPCNVLHLYTAAITNVNGVAANAIYVAGAV